MTMKNYTLKAIVFATEKHEGRIIPYGLSVSLKVSKSENDEKILNREFQH